MKAIKWITTVLAVLAWILTLASGFAAIWTVDAAVSGRFNASAGVCLFSGIALAFVAGCLWAEDK